MDQPGRPPVAKKVFTSKANTAAEEAEYDFVALRRHPKPISVTGAVMHLIKGALGGGVLSGHVSYMKAGVCTAIILNIALGIYMTICLYLLVHSAQILYRRTHIHTMTYSEVGEAAVTLFPNPKVNRYGKYFRYLIDGLVTLDLFGACTTYQLMIAGTIKQFVENVQETHNQGLNGHPHLRVYMAAMLIPFILLCWIVHLKWLAPFSTAANATILLCVGVALYYAAVRNPTLSGMTPYTTLYGTLEYCGMIVFAISCAGVVIPVENVMRQPQKFKYALTIAMVVTILIMIIISFAGYVAYLEDCRSPITINFPMNLASKLLKGFMAVMIYFTHGINFWVPFNSVFYYIKRLHRSKFMMWELFYRALFVSLITFIGIVFPSIESLMGFLGNFCLSNLAFVFPNVINLLTIWDRPGFGYLKWRLWRGIIFIIIGLFLGICGSLVAAHSLVLVFKDNM